MKTDAERGPIGAWARSARLAAGYSSAEHAVEAAGAAGVHLTVAYLRGIEAGWHKPGRELLGELARLYSTQPPLADSQPVSAEWLEAVREAVAEGVELGVTRAIERLGSEPPPLHPPRPRR